MRIAIFGNDYQQQFLPQVQGLFDLLAKHCSWVGIDRNYYEHLQRVLPGCTAKAELIDSDDFSADIAISLGGDGTFLRTAQRVAAKGMPILGINAGHLGYLTAASADEIPLVIDELLANRYVVENRTMLQVSSADIGFDTPFALNEIAVLRQDTSSMISMTTKVNGKHLATYKGDGLIISTPTGSTAYNLSCGGPILEPTTSIVAVTPVSPHSMTMRPLVMSDNSVIEITTISRACLYQVSIDGRTVNCRCGTKIVISKAPFTAKVIQRVNHDFASCLRNKLMWGADNL